MDDKTKKFIQDYEMKVLDDNKRYQRRGPINQFFADELRADVIHRGNIEHVTERLYTVEIPESRLNTLAEMENRFYNHRADRGTRDMFEMLMDKEREEAYYRNTNEAVKKAYENYSMLLHLAGYVKKL